MNKKIFFFISLVLFTYLVVSSPPSCNVSQCISCSSPHDCQNCTSGHYLSIDDASNNQTICLPYTCNLGSCQLCSADDFCQTCSMNFTQVNGTCVCTDPTQMCACDQGFVLSGDMCMECSIQNCQNCSSINMCDLCAPSYTLHIENRCVLCQIVECEYCQQDNICGQCSEQRQLNDQGTACISDHESDIDVRTFPAPCSITNCLFCFDSDTRCLICDSELEPTYDLTQCVSCDLIGCLFCSANDVCQECMQSYTKNQQNQCVVCNQPCSVCKSDGTCSECVRPFSLFANATGNCFECKAQNCRVCNESNLSQCLQCRRNFNLIAGSCSKTCSVPNCKSCNTTGACLECETYFMVFQGNCQMCTEAPKCEECRSDNSSICIKCADGYFLNNGLCSSCLDICKKCVNGNSCTELQTSIGRTLVGTEVVSCPYGCDKCSSTDPSLCVLCLDGFVKNNNSQCEPCEYPCKTCTVGNRSACLSCYDDSPLVNGTCLLCDGSCTSCLSTNRNHCTSCEEGVILSGGVCAGNCSQNCLYCTSATVCTKCADGFGLTVQKDCLPCLLSCKKCAGENIDICLECGEGLVLIDSVCVACPSSCKQCEKVNGQLVCKVCEEGTQLLNQICVETCEDPCATCKENSPSECTSCLKDYTFDASSSTCVPITTCNGGCTSCPLGFNKVNTSCIATQSNCAKSLSTNLTFCTACLIGTYLNRNGQCLSCPSGCRRCNNGNVCLKCEKGFVIQRVGERRNSKICKACDFPCKTCARKSSYCLSCVDKYFLQGWKCITKFHLQFSVVFNLNFAIYATKYRQILVGLTKAAKLPSNVGVSMRRCRQGSTQMTGAISMDSQPSSDQTKSIYQSLSSSLTPGKELQGVPILSLSLEAKGGTIESVGSGQSQFRKMPSLVYILAIGIPIIVASTFIPYIVIFTIGILIYCRHKKWGFANNQQRVQIPQKSSSRKMQEIL